MQQEIRLECSPERAIELLRENGRWTEQDLEKLYTVFTAIKVDRVTVPISEANNGEED